MGGTVANPTYHMVCTDTTGHVETVYIEYDPDKVSYDELLNVFWQIHDPTLVNRQGPDVGSQYRSEIFFYTPEQEREATISKKKLEESGRFKKPIATIIQKAGPFYRAEEYHQRYYEKHGMAGCGINLDFDPKQAP
jgi:peptide-methionine (S)-S-oxide reductase